MAIESEFTSEERMNSYLKPTSRQLSRRHGLYAARGSCEPTDWLAALVWNSASNTGFVRVWSTFAFNKRTSWTLSKLSIGLWRIYRNVLTSKIKKWTTCSFGLNAQTNCRSRMKPVGEKEASQMQSHGFEFTLLNIEEIEQWLEKTLRQRNLLEQALKGFLHMVQRIHTTFFQSGLQDRCLWPRILQKGDSSHDKNSDIPINLFQ